MSDYSFQSEEGDEIMQSELDNIQFPGTVKDLADSILENTGATKDGQN